MSLGNTVNISKTEFVIFSLRFDPFVFSVSMAGTNIDSVAQTGMLELTLPFPYLHPTLCSENAVTFHSTYLLDPLLSIHTILNVLEHYFLAGRPQYPKLLLALSNPFSTL